MRHLFASTALFLFLTAPAFAGCEHYAGHFDLEGKIGNKRNLGEASAFLPVACTQDRLLFTDLKFRADTLSNREANIGIGGRVQREDGIVGGYIYFDRKKSGETDKFYNQITTGAEWLADHWETRANVYIPLNGSKTIGSGVVVSDPYLAGTGIFIDRGGFQIKETPMYGADTEIGFQTTENLWLYGGGFTFHGNDVPSITGARIRAKYDLTEKISLNAEGQYDDEHGRQGWLGARLSIPFGPGHTTRSRMTQSPVRDVDIVTQAKTTFEPQTTTTLTNPNSGDAQRVIYVDNSASTTGDGSLEKPYNTLADAQGDLRDYDIVYVFHGTGTSAGMDQGFAIDKNNVSFIGEGSPLTFAGYTLRAAGERPVITNQQAPINPEDGVGIFVAAANIFISGVEINDAQRHGIRASSSTGNNGNLTIENVVTRDNVGSGISVGASSGSYDSIVLRNIYTDRNIGAAGTAISATNNGYIGSIFASNIYSQNNGGAGISITTSTGGHIGHIDLDNVHSASNIREGYLLSAGTLSNAGGRIDSIKVTNSTAINNALDGFLIRAVRDSSTAGNPSYIGPAELSNLIVQGSARYGLYLRTTNDSVIEKVTVDHSVITDQTNHGVYIIAQSRSFMNDVSITNSDIVANKNRGLFIDDETTNTFNISLNGNNRIFGNGTANPAAPDIILDLDGSLIPLDARNNWWGQSGGPLPGQIQSQGTGTPPNPNTGSADTTDALDSDPRP